MPAHQAIVPIENRISSTKYKVPDLHYRLEAEIEAKDNPRIVDQAKAYVLKYWEILLKEVCLQLELSLDSLGFPHLLEVE